MTRFFRCLSAFVVVILLVSPTVWGQSRSGTLQMIGVPPDVQGGSYDSSSGVFTADVSDIPEAYIQVTFDDLRITGQELEWHTKDEQLTFSQSVKVWREDLELDADWLHYDSAAEIMTARGAVKVTTEDAVIYADELVYSEETDEALFTGNVIVDFEDGELKGEKFLLRVEEKTMQFFGPFQGTFQSNSK